MRKSTFRFYKFLLSIKYQSIISNCWGQWLRLDVGFGSAQPSLIIFGLLGLSGQNGPPKAQPIVCRAEPGHVVGGLTHSSQAGLVGPQKRPEAWLFYFRPGKHEKWFEPSLTWDSDRTIVGYSVPDLSPAHLTQTWPQPDWARPDRLLGWTSSQVLMGLTRAGYQVLYGSPAWVTSLVEVALCSKFRSYLQSNQ